MIREIIVATRNANGSDYLAPMGIHTGGKKITLTPFKPSTTLDNLLRERCAVINYTDDVRVFAGCLSGHRNWRLTPVMQGRGKRLSNALAHAEVEITQVWDDDVRPRLLCTTIHRETHAPFQGFNRAQAAIIEFAILVSRLDRLPWDKVQRELEYLQIAVDKTAGADEKLAYGWLMEKIVAFKQQNNINE